MAAAGHRLRRDAPHEQRRVLGGRRGGAAPAPGPAGPAAGRGGVPCRHRARRRRARRGRRRRRRAVAVAAPATAAPSPLPPTCGGWHDHRHVRRRRRGRPAHRRPRPPHAGPPARSGRLRRPRRRARSSSSCSSTPARSSPEARSTGCWRPPCRRRASSPRPAATTASPSPTWRVPSGTGPRSSCRRSAPRPRSPASGRSAPTSPSAAPCTRTPRTPPPPAPTRPARCSSIRTTTRWWWPARARWPASWTRRCADLDTVLVAVGGGGLIAGVAAWFGDRVRIVSVEPATIPAMYEARRAGRPVTVGVSGLAADSLGANAIGAVPFATAAPFVAEAVLVTDDAIRDAAARPVGVGAAAGRAGWRGGPGRGAVGAYRPAPDERVVVVVCGANVDPERSRARPERQGADRGGCRRRSAAPCRASTDCPSAASRRRGGAASTQFTS